MIAKALGRAFASNLRILSVADCEQSTLQAAGIQEPTIQRYFVWRRSVALVVVLVTLLSAGLATYCEYTETGDRLSGLQTRLEGLLENAEEVLPLPDVMDDPSSDEGDEEETAEATKPSGVTDASSAEGEGPATAFGRFADGVHLVSLYAMPLAAMLVLLCWTRLKLSFQILLAGFAFGFFVPMLIALCPWSWWGYVEPNVSPEKDPAQFFLLAAESVLEGSVYLVTLLPTVLSLVPGVQRACLRVKTLLPESVLPGWFLVSAAPFYALFLLVIFVAVNQIASDPIFLIGMFLVMAAPFLYVARADVFTRPLLSEDDYKRMRSMQRIIGGITALAGITLLVYLASQQVLGVRLIGFDEKTSVFRPIDLVGFVLELLGRSLFMTLLGADLFMRMNLAAWRHERTLADSPAAANYHRAMGELEQVAK